MGLDVDASARIVRGMGRITIGVVLAVLPILSFNGQSVLLPAAAVAVLAGTVELARVPGSTALARRCFTGLTATAAIAAVVACVAFVVPAFAVVGAVAMLAASHLLLGGAWRLSTDVGADGPARWWRAAFRTLLVEDVLLVAVLLAVASEVGFERVRLDSVPAPSDGWFLTFGASWYRPTSVAASALAVAALVIGAGVVVLVLTSTSQLRRWARRGSEPNAVVSGSDLPAPS